jgi:hypothetical protein
MITFISFFGLFYCWAIRTDNDHKIPIKLPQSKNIEKRTRSRYYIKTQDTLFGDSFPSIKQQPLVNKIFEDVKIHHKWFAIVYHYSTSFPRPFRVLSLFSNIVVLLFIQTITYNISNPDDGTCNKLISEFSCLLPKSPFGTGGSKCLWSTEDQCRFSPPEKNINLIIFVALLSAAIGTPVSLFINLLIQHVLCSGRNCSTVLKNRHSLFGLEILNCARNDMNAMMSRMKVYRISLSEQEKKHFDGIFILFL